MANNQLCGGHSVQVRLAWHGVQNRDGVGAQLTLQTSLGPLQRDVRAASGYLAGDAPTVHFGMPVDTNDQPAGDPVAGWTYQQR